MRSGPSKRLSKNDWELFESALRPLDIFDRAFAALDGVYDFMKNLHDVAAALRVDPLEDSTPPRIQAQMEKVVSKAAALTTQYKRIEYLAASSLGAPA